MQNNQEGAPSHLLDRFPRASITRKWLARGQQWQQEPQLQSPIQGLQSTGDSSGPSLQVCNYKLSLQIHSQRGNLMASIILRDDESRMLPRASLIVALFRYLASNTFQISNPPRPDHEIHWSLLPRCSVRPTRHPLKGMGKENWR